MCFFAVSMMVSTKIRSTYYDVRRRVAISLTIDLVFAMQGVRHMWERRGIATFLSVTFISTCRSIARRTLHKRYFTILPRPPLS